MSTTAAQLLVKISADGAKETKDDIKGVSDATDKAGDHTHSLLDTMAGFVGGAAIVHVAGDAFGFLKDQVTDSWNEGIQANQVLAQLAAGLKSTHDASGQTVDSLEKMAEQLSNTTGITKSSVETGQAMLLTFEGIGKSVLPQATQAMADMATKMAGGAIPNAQQMQQTALQLGKALGDPTKGYASLQRVGVTFSKQQVDQIKTMQKAGDIAGAQKVILNELNKEFGNSATAAGQANGGLAILSAQFDNMKEALGQQLIPIMGQLLGLIQPIASALLGGLGGAISGITPFVSQMEGAFKSLPLAPLSQAFERIKTALHGVSGEIAGAALPVLSQLGGFFTAHILPAVTQFTNFAATTLIPMLGDIAAFLISTVVPALLRLAGFVTSTVLPAVEQLIGWFRANVLPVLMTVVSVIAQNVLPVLENLANIIITQVIPPIERIGAVIIPLLIPAFQAIGWVISNVVGPVLGFLFGLLGKLLDIIANVVVGIRNFIAGVGGDFSRFGTLVHTILSRIGDLFVWLYNHNTYVKKLVDFIHQKFTEIKDTISRIWNDVTGFIGGLASKIGGAVNNGVITPIKNAVSGMISDALQWGGNLIKMFVQGITNHAGDIKSAAANALGGLGKILGFHSAAEEGPGADADTWAPNLMKMFAQGLVDATPTLANAAAQAMGGVRGVLTGGATGTLGISGGAGLVAPSSAALLSQQIASAGSVVGGSSGQPVILQVDGRTLAQALVPHLPGVLRHGTAVRGY